MKVDFDLVRVTKKGDIVFVKCGRVVRKMLKGTFVYPLPEPMLSSWEVKGIKYEDSDCN